MEVSATAKMVPVSPRKVRLLLEKLPGKTVDEAIILLRYAPTPMAKDVAKVVQSAAANAENNYQMSPGDLRIKYAVAGEGKRLKRYRARSRGRPSPYVKRTSHITIVVEEQE